MIRTAGWWLRGITSTAVVGCTIYDPSLVPGAQRDAAFTDVGSESADRADSSAGDAATTSEEAPVGAVDAQDDPLGPSDAPLGDDGDATSRPDADAAVADAPAQIEAAPVCDATCLARCSDRVMNGRETRLDCGGDCPAETCPPAPAITNLVVNDDNIGQDGILNRVQWSLGTSFADGEPAYGDRPFTLSARDLPQDAAHLVGRPWIRTAADSKLYSSTTTPVATATVSGTFIYIATDERQNLTLLENDGYTYQFVRFDFREDNVVRHYTIWRKPILSSPATVAFPSVTSVASFYLVIVE